MLAYVKALHKTKRGLEFLQYNLHVHLHWCKKEKAMLVTLD